MRRSLRSIVLALAILTPVGVAAPAAGASAPSTVAVFTCRSGYYENSSHRCVKRPVKPPKPAWPAGSTARCRDGSYSFSQHRSGTCSHHGGVAAWR
jgi:hypothetical protein